MSFLSLLGQLGRSAKTPTHNVGYRSNTPWGESAAWMIIDEEWKLMCIHLGHSLLYKCPPTHICSTCSGQIFTYSLHTAFHSHTMCTKPSLMGNCVSFQPAKRQQECRLINMHTHEHRPMCIHTVPSQTDVPKHPLAQGHICTCFSNRPVELKPLMACHRWFTQPKPVWSSYQSAAFHWVVWHQPMWRRPDLGKNRGSWDRKSVV